jgi:hypothetical protein
MAKTKERENRLLFVNTTDGGGDPIHDGNVMEMIRGIGWIRGIVVSVEARDDWELRGIADELETEFQSRGWSVTIGRDPVVMTDA